MRRVLPTVSPPNRAVAIPAGIGVGKRKSRLSTDLAWRFGHRRADRKVRIVERVKMGRISNLRRDTSASTARGQSARILCSASAAALRASSNGSSSNLESAAVAGFATGPRFPKAFAAAARTARCVSLIA